MRDDELQEIEARAAAATPGPWFTQDCPSRRHGDGLVNVVTDHGLTPLLEWCSPEDGAFAARARTDVPALVAEVRRLRQLSVRVGEQARVEQPPRDLAPDPRDAQGLGNGPRLSSDERGDGVHVQAGHAAQVVGADLAHGDDATSRAAAAAWLEGRNAGLDAAKLAFDGILSLKLAAARDAALDEAATLLSKQALFSREQDFLADGVDLDRYAADIRALKVPA